MKNIFKRIIPCLLIVMILFLTGCTNQDYTLVVNSDDTARFTIRYIVDKDTYELLEAYDIETNYKFEQSMNSANSIERCDVLFQEAASIFHKYGFKINPVNDAIEIGFEATKDYKTIEELNKDLPKLYENGLTGFNGQVTISQTLLAKTYLFSGTVKYYTDPDAELSETDKAQLLELYDTSNLNADVFLKMPGDLVALDGIVENAMAKYTASYEEGQEIPVHLKTQIVNTALRTLIIIVVVILAAVVFVFISRKKKKQKEAQKMRELYGSEDDDDEEY